MKSTRHEPDQFFSMPKDIIKKAAKDTLGGITIKIKPSELIKAMMRMDRLIDQDTGDTDYDAMRVAREWMSDVFEDPSRRAKKP